MQEACVLRPTRGRDRVSAIRSASPECHWKGAFYKWSGDRSDPISDSNARAPKMPAKYKMYRNGATYISPLANGIIDVLFSTQRKIHNASIDSLTAPLSGQVFFIHSHPSQGPDCKPHRQFRPFSSDMKRRRLNGRRGTTLRRLRWHRRFWCCRCRFQWYLWLLNPVDMW